MRTITYHDPAAMSPENRRKEIARILAAGYLRLLVQKGRIRLASLAATIPDGSAKKSAKEVA